MSFQVRIRIGGLLLAGQEKPGDSLWLFLPDLGSVAASKADNPPHAVGHPGMANGHQHAHRALLWIAGAQAVPGDDEPIIDVDIYDLRDRVIRIALTPQERPAALDFADLLPAGSWLGFELDPKRLHSGDLLAYPGKLLSRVQIEGGACERSMRSWTHPDLSQRPPWPDHNYGGALTWQGVCTLPSLAIHGLGAKGAAVDVRPSSATLGLDMGVIFVPEDEFPRNVGHASDPKAHVKLVERFILQAVGSGGSHILLPASSNPTATALRTFCPALRLF